VEVYTFVGTETLRASVGGSSWGRWLDGGRCGFALGYGTYAGVPVPPGEPLWRAYSLAAEPLSVNDLS
jgi:hypothetical protein